VACCEVEGNKRREEKRRGKKAMKANQILPGRRFLCVRNWEELFMHSNGFFFLPPSSLFSEWVDVRKKERKKEKRRGSKNGKRVNHPRQCAFMREQLGGTNDCTFLLSFFLLFFCSEWMDVKKRARKKEKRRGRKT
jgi:hypothetical protein